MTSGAGVAPEVCRPQDRGEEGAGIGAPFAPGGVRGVRDEGARELVGVVRVAQFAEEVPARRAGVERIQDHIAAIRIVEAVEVAAIRIRDECAIAASQRDA